MHQVHLGEIVGQGALQGRRIGVAPVVVQLDRLDADLEHLAGAGAANGDRTRAHVTGSFGVCAACTAASAAGTFRGEPGIMSRPPDTVETVTVSPESTVSTGGRAASK
jgi:hypothetical protein